MPANDLTAVLLAGGSGTRLWPLSRRSYPKHLIGILEPTSLLQTTVFRVAPLCPADRVITVGAEAQGDLLKRQLADADQELLQGLLLEPSARNTAAACAVAAIHAAARFGPETVLWICAADHVVTEPDVLLDSVHVAAEAARAGYLVTFGIEPAYPEPGFGYIQVGSALGDVADTYAVRGFVEKPDRDRAEAMLAEGGYLWNSGMFVFRADAFLAELAEHAPAVHAASLAAVPSTMTAAPGPHSLPGDAYAQIPSEPVDKAVMERSARLAVVPSDPGWSDLGSWLAVWEKSAHDAHGNAVIGNAMIRDSDGCFVLARERLVAVTGQSDLAVIDTPDALYVGPLHNSGAVKAVAQSLADAGRPEADDHREQIATWGSRERLDSAPEATVDRYRLIPGGSCVAEGAGLLHVMVATGEIVIEPGARKLHAGAQGAVTVVDTAGLSEAVRFTAGDMPATVIVVHPTEPPG